MSQTLEPTSTSPKTEEPKPGDPPKDPKTEVPATYEFKAPDGYTLDPKVIEEATPIFKELNLTQDQAQKLIDIQLKREISSAEAGQKAYNDMRAGWVAEVKADAEIGGKLSEVKQTIGKGLDSLGDPTLVASFKEAMNLTGAGDHPAFVKAMYKMSQRLTEGAPVSGKGPSPHGQTAPNAAPPTAASALYPNLK